MTSNLFEELSRTDPLCQVFPGTAATALGADETLQGWRPLSNVTFAGNTFRDLENVDGYMEGVLLLGGVSNSSVIDNDFTQSGIPGLEAGSTASVGIFTLDVFLPGLGAASDILVFQTPNTLPANSTIDSHFYNLGGTDVTVIGLPNGRSGRPIGPQMQGIIEQRIGLGEYLRPGHEH